MRIAHYTNTFLPHVGGVARAVQTILEDQRKAHHRVLVVAPEFAGGHTPARIERSVLRIPALKNFNSSDFSVRLPLAATLSTRLAAFKADVIHAHHPFLLGDTALRESASRQIPILFTHHTLYENYTHYLPVEGDTVGDFAAEVATRFANRCDAAIAPSESVRDLMISRGVTVPVHVIPTGIDTRRIATGRGGAARKRWKIPERATVIGHLGRLAEEKNLMFLANALALALRQAPTTHALIVGDGPDRANMERVLKEAGVSERVAFTGMLTGQRLLDACAAMDVFAFTSTSETQGLVLAEVMAAGSGVIALDASGVRDVVRDRQNGRLLPAKTTSARFARALVDVTKNQEVIARWSKAAVATAAGFDRRSTSKRLLALYTELIEARRQSLEKLPPVTRALKPVVERVATEGQIIADKAGALLAAVTGTAPSTTNHTA